MKHHHILTVGSSAFFLLGCLGLTACSGSDNAPLNPAGGTSSNSSASGGATAAGGSSATSATTASGGSTASTASASGGSSASSQQGGASNQGGSSAANGGTSTASSKDTSAKGGSASGGSSSSTAGGTSAKGGTSSSNGVGGATAAGGTSASSNTSAGGATTAGGASSAGGSSNTAAGTTAGGGGSAEVTPTKVSDSDYKLDLKTCGVVMDVNPKIGARISKLTLAGKDIIVPFTMTTYDRAATGNNAGSTFWTSPQKDWPVETWPPVTAIDGGTYTPTLEGNHLVATGTANATQGVSVVKDFSADDGSCWITQLFTMKAAKAISVAPWQITRVARGGIAFFPVGDATKLVPGPLQAKVSTSSSPSVAWFDDTTKSSTSSDGSKLIADGSGGWLAYALGGNLYIKKFTDVTDTSKFAPSEGDVEIYPGTDYLELEVQGAYTSLAANGTLPWTVKWRVVAIPTSVTVAPKSDTLLAFAQEQVAK